MTDGVGLIQSRGGEVITMQPGDTVYTPPGEWHWHGASADSFMSHLAMWEDDDATSGGPRDRRGVRHGRRRIELSRL